jgi:glycine/D-amino acid oxidase-like deaminating enzyme
MKTIMCAALLGLTVVANAPGAPATVYESARDIPLAYDVDVVVVGGGVGAVSAAAAAADAGAEVFLAAPRTYLGEDVAGTLRMWVSPDAELDSPLAQRLFGPAGMAESTAIPVAGKRLDLTYKADLPSESIHPDSKPPRRLTDGKWNTATRQSVQYNGDVTLTADLGAVKDIGKVCALVYHAKDFLVQNVVVAVSDDGNTWREVAVIENTAPKSHEDLSALPLTADVDGKARYVRFLVTRRKDSTRILVGELIVTGPDDGSATEAVPIRLVRPLHLKRELDGVLIEKGVRFLFGCIATDILRDADGKPAGIVMANRAGRQAVKAKVIIDATDRAWAARVAGAEFRPHPAGPLTFTRVVVGGEAPSDREHAPSKALGAAFKRFDVHAYRLDIDVADGSYRSYALAEQRARDLTYRAGQQSAADMLGCVPPDPVKARRSVTGPWPGVDKVDLGAFQPRGVDRLFVLGGCADVERGQVGQLLAPVGLVGIGARVGEAAARMAIGVTGSDAVSLPGTAAGGRGEVREFLRGVRSHRPRATVRQGPRELPVLGEYDVVVIGGGTGGAPAGIAAARQGAKTLVVEYQNGLGGVGTIGRISKYYWGNRVGFTATVPDGASWPVEGRMEWWRNEIRKAGGEIWFGSLGCGAYLVDGKVAGAVVATPQGRGVVLAKTVIDATGNSDVAAAAGAACIYTDASDLALQGTGLPPHHLGRDYTNTDYTIVDETDMLDVWNVFVFGKHMTGGQFDFGKLIDTRERRRIIGEHTITILEQILDRTHADTVVQAYSNFDTHGYTVHPYFTINYPHKKGLGTHIPLRAMLPRGLDGILVIGLGLSAHRDAVPCTRMQPDIQNGGYAAGVAAAMAAKAGTDVRHVDIKALQRHLVDIGNLKESVLTDGDSFPLPEERVRAAVESGKDPYLDIAVILAHPEKALPYVQKAFQSAQKPEEKLHLAKLLSVLGDDAGLDVILDVMRASAELDSGWSYRGMGQFGSCMSDLDTLAYALGRIGSARAVPALVAKLKLLRDETEFSHFRAFAVALERIGDASAVDALAEVLSREDIRGRAIAGVEGSVKRAGEHGSWTTTTPRAQGLRELFLARALYRCGDKDGLGRRVLEEYSRDLRGHFARHARAVLEESR